MTYGDIPGHASASSSGSMKTEWPELVGLDGDEAKSIILSEAPEIKVVQIIPEGMMATMDYSRNRVRIWVDKERKVSTPPIVG
eukprot:jgi/Mesen1/10159/ME000076S09669